MIGEGTIKKLVLKWKYEWVERYDTDVKDLNG
jgi:hypothetical protein